MAFALFIFNVPAFRVKPPEKIFVPESDNVPAPAFTNPPVPLIVDVIIKSELNPPFATVKVRADAPSATGADTVAVEALELVVTFPAKVKVPVPIMEVPVKFTDPVDGTLKVAKLKTPLLTVKALVIVVLATKVTVFEPTAP